MSNHNEISSFIWRVCDDELRGLFKPHEYGEVILPFVVLRRLDCLLEEKKDEVVELYNELKDQIDDLSPIIRKRTGLSFYNTSRFDLKRLKSDPNGLKMNFPNYLNGFSENVFQIIENFQLDKPVEKLLKNNKLYSLIDKFTEVDLHPSKVDNHTMGSIFEELLRKFSEMSNETSGEHYTPRDIVNLLVSLVFTGDEENLSGEGIIRTIFDPCCGTGGMLTIGKDWVNENISDEVRFQLYGQELNPQTFSICKSDFLITGEEPDNIRLGSSLSNDQFIGRQFDYMITNPPFGVSWKSEQSFIEDESKNPQGRFSVGTPRTSDGSLLFLQHMISKMRPEGSRIGVVFNGSPLFSGDSGSGESEIRKWIIENDWLECIVSLPNNLFFNTGITTYIWILTNKKKLNRKGKIQLINGESFFSFMKKKLGEKRKEIDENHRIKILDLYTSFEENEFSRIYENEFFGYNKIIIEQPKIENGKILRDKNGNLKPDSKLRDFERVPLGVDIEEYYEKNVLPHLQNSWVNYDNIKKGYEINFTKYFYNYQPLRSSDEIVRDILDLDNEIEGIQNQIFQ
jgi:type I restriction enzyme M protein